MTTNELKALRERLSDDQALYEYFDEMRNGYSETLWNIAKNGKPSADELLILLGEMRNHLRMEKTLLSTSTRVKK